MKKLIILSLISTSISLCIAQENIGLFADTLSTSHVSGWENLNAINDGFHPFSSSDKSNGAYGNWPKNADEVENWDWVQYSWDSLYIIDRSRIYWWTDGGGIQIPDESYIHYRDILTGNWIEVPGHSGFIINTDAYSEVIFEPVLTNGIRYHMMSMTQSTGILEWEVYGEPGEQHLYKSFIEVSPEFKNGGTSRVKLTAIGAENELVSGYQFLADVEIINHLTGETWNDEIYEIAGISLSNNLLNMELPLTDENGETGFDVSIPDMVDPSDGLLVTLKYADGLIPLNEVSYSFPARFAPVLSADLTENTVDHDIQISFEDNADWRQAVTAVLVDDSPLASVSDYEISAGILTLKASGGSKLLTSSGMKNICVKALGFEDCTVQQELLSGVASAENTVFESLSTLFKGTRSLLRITAKDRYGNTLNDYGLIYDVLITNNDPARTEEYIIDASKYSETASDISLAPTDSAGQVLIELIIPAQVDLYDGISIVLKLPEGSEIGKIGYLDASLSASLISGRTIGEIAIAGRLYTELHSEFMLGRNDHNTVLNWYNLGYSGGGKDNEVGGNFGNFGLDVPWDERDIKYPSVDTIKHLPSVHFNGSNIIKSNYSEEEDITGINTFSLEIWAYDEKPDASEVLLGWQSEDGSTSSATISWPEGMTAMNEWRHLAVSCGHKSESWYLDGQLIKSIPRRLQIASGHRIVLGGASEIAPSFEGHLLTLRIHQDSITPTQIMHNYLGGGMLGTRLRFNFDPEVKPSEAYKYHTWSDANPEDFYYVESEHFDQRISRERLAGMSEADRNAFFKRVPDMLELAEACYHNYGEVHALRMPVVSNIARYRGDGIKYRIKIGTTDGANYMGWHGSLGFGYPMQFPGYINPHELVHGIQAQTGSGIQGNYWEAHANFPQTYLGIYQTIPSFLEFRDQNLFEASGRSYYHSRLMFQHLAETPEYGPMFISKLWYDGMREAYPWLSFKLLDPDPSTSLGYEWARMAMKNVTWDYTIHTPWNSETSHNAELYRNEVKNNYDVSVVQGFIKPEELPDEPGWFRAPKAKIPQQTGWNIVPLRSTAGKVSIELGGYVDPERGSRWYGGLVAVNEEGLPRYSDIISNNETLDFDIVNNEHELYFVVVAIPDQIMAINMVGDVRLTEQDPFPYKVRIDGAEPVDMVADYYKEKYSGISGHYHSKGGGFVDSRASVSETAYVGPNARVIGNSKVLDSARIEDYAIVDQSTVSGHAIISGHGMVIDNSRVEDYARIRDYGKIERGSGLSGNAKIAEFATVSSGSGKYNSEYSTIKGISILLNGNVSGSAMIDHHFTKGQDVSNGKWFTWSWGSGQNAGESKTDYNGLYLRMSFEKEHPYMAWDDFGITWGYLVNGATTVSNSESQVLSLDGINQYVELQKDVSDQIFASLEFDFCWKGGANNQPVFDFGNAAGNNLFFTPSNENGRPELVMNYSGLQERISGAEQLALNEWVHISIYFGKAGASIYANDALLGVNEQMHIRNLTINAGAFSNFLGRNQDGDIYFDGLIDNFIIYNKDLSENQTGSYKSEYASDFVKIYPNPVSDQLMIKINSDMAADITILDFSGKTIIETGFRNQLCLARSDFGPSGVYSVIVREEGRIHAGKIIIL